MLLALVACGEKPSDMYMDIYNGNSRELKLLHVKANDATRIGQIEGILSAIEDAEEIDKPMDLFGYYPDYLIDICPRGTEEILTVVVDLNGDYVEFYYPGPNPEPSEVVYRSSITAEEFSNFINVW